MSLIVCGVEDAQEALRTNLALAEVPGLGNKIEAVISIAGHYLKPRGFDRPPALEDAEAAGAKVLRLNFEDCESPIPEDGGPTREDVERIFAFADEVGFREIFREPRRLFVIHCAAGQSRSTGAALALLARHRNPGAALERAYDQLERCAVEERHDLSPNMSIVKLADSILGLEGKLVDVNRRRKGW